MPACVERSLRHEPWGPVVLASLSSVTKAGEGISLQLRRADETEHSPCSPPLIPSGLCLMAPQSPACPRSQLSSFDHHGTLFSQGWTHPFPLWNFWALGLSPDSFP